jgi:FMN phosphatase YigB (HAD superfamily)
LNLENLFDSIMAADDFGKEYWKPSAKIMSIIRENFGTGKRNYLVVGNGTDDLGFAQNAGLEFIFIKRPHQLKIIDRFPGRTVGNLNELLTHKFIRRKIT